MSVARAPQRAKCEPGDQKDQSNHPEWLEIELVLRGITQIDRRAYPPFILATTAAAMDVKVSMFFTFYGLPLLLRKLDLQISPLGKPDMAMPMLGMHMKMPNMMAMLPGVNGMATRMMKNLIKKKGVASIEDLRATAIESEVEMIGCQMTMDLFEFKKKDMIPGIKIGGAATYMEKALKSEINMFI